MPSDHPARKLRRRGGGESGSALIIAMVFLVIGSILVIALANMAGASLTSSNSFSSQRNLEYAADGATNAAIQTTRYSSTCGAFPGPASTVTINNLPLRVTCTAVTSDSSQRTLTFSAFSCPGGSCAATAILTARVQYIDVYISSGTTLPRRGASMQILAWDVQTIS